MLGEEFLEVSKSLLKTPKEAAYRSAANRAYYYDLNSSFFRGQAFIALIVASADQMIAAVKRCQQSQDLRLQIRNGIREYERKINP
jgi:hypothetical protein